MSSDLNSTKNYKAIIENEVKWAIAKSRVKDLKFATATNLMKTLCYICVIASGIGLFMMLQVSLFMHRTINPIIHVLGYALSIPILISSSIWLVCILQKKKNAKAILATLRVGRIYQKAFEDLFYPNFEYLDISKTFYVSPHLYPSGNVYVNKVINFKDKYDNIISLGTVTKKVVRQTRDSKGNVSKHESYHCYRILSAVINKDFKMNATISFKRFFSKDNAVLESQLFEKTFATVTNNQIELRKLLTPKVIDNLNKLAGFYRSETPKMSFNGSTICFLFPSIRVSGFDDLDNTLQAIFFKKNNQIVEEVTDKVEYDFKYIKRIFIWFKAFDLIDSNISVDDNDRNVEDDYVFLKH